MADGQRALRVRPVALADIGDVLVQGWRDLVRAPVYGLALGGMFAAGGWAILAMLYLLDVIYLAYPLAMGFALIAPFAAVGFYAVSEHLEEGRPLSWGSVWAAVKEAARRDLRWMALVTAFAFFLWMDMAAILFFSFFGFVSLDMEFVRELFGTANGWMFLLVGNLAGAAIALAVFSFSAVSFPLLYDRDIDFVTAMTTSVQVVASNPVAMIAWCAVVAAFTGLGIATAFVGLIVVLPWVGHATWHLYRRAVGVEPAAGSTDAVSRAARRR